MSVSEEAARPPPRWASVATGPLSAPGGRGKSSPACEPWGTEEEHGDACPPKPCRPHRRPYPPPGRGLAHAQCSRGHAAPMAWRSQWPVGRPRRPRSAPGAARHAVVVRPARLHLTRLLLPARTVASLVPVGTVALSSGGRHRYGRLPTPEA